MSDDQPPRMSNEEKRLASHRRWKHDKGPTKIGELLDRDKSCISRCLAAVRAGGCRVKTGRPHKLTPERQQQNNRCEQREE